MVSHSRPVVQLKQLLQMPSMSQNVLILKPLWTDVYIYIYERLGSQSLLSVRTALLKTSMGSAPINYSWERCVDAGCAICYNGGTR